MDIGKINNNLVNNIIDRTKSSSVDGDSFEKRLQKAMDENDEKALKKACEDFESIFLNMLYKQMKATVPKSDLIPSDAGRDIFESMLDETLMEQASKSQRFGLADSLYKQLGKKLKTQYKVVGEGEQGIEESI